jgi:hypothetical protein
MKTLKQYTMAELEPFAKEWLKRKRAERTTQPRPKVERPCPHCGLLFGARELRAHKPQCTKKRPPAAGDKR